MVTVASCIHLLFCTHIRSRNDPRSTIIDILWHGDLAQFFATNLQASIFVVVLKADHHITPGNVLCQIQGDFTFYATIFISYRIIQYDLGIICHSRFLISNIEQWIPCKAFGKKAIDKSFSCIDIIDQITCLFLIIVDTYLFANLPANVTSFTNWYLKFYTNLIAAFSRELKGGVLTSSYYFTTPIDAPPDVSRSVYFRN